MSASKKTKTKIDLKEEKINKNIFRDKEILIMRIGVIALTVIIILLWTVNQKNVWRNNNNSEVEISNDIIKIFQESEPEFEEGKEILNNGNIDKRLENDAGKLLEDVMREADKRATSTGFINCPEWINCMPTIGEARSCVIPLGCEDITKIAY